MALARKMRIFAPLLGCREPVGQGSAAALRTQLKLCTRCYNVVVPQTEE